jgi:hypothetical protein
MSACSANVLQCHSSPRLASGCLQDKAGPTSAWVHNGDGRLLLLKDDKPCGTQRPFVDTSQSMNASPSSRPGAIPGSSETPCLAKGQNNIEAQPATQTAVATTSQTAQVAWSGQACRIWPRRTGRGCGSAQMRQQTWRQCSSALALSMLLHVCTACLQSYANRTQQFLSSHHLGYWPLPLS